MDRANAAAVPDDRSWNPAAMPLGSMSAKVSGLYFAVYLHYGFFAFIPLWLKTMGTSPGEIGALLAIPLAVRLLTVAPFSAWSGRRGQVRNMVIVTALGSAALIALLTGHPGHAGRIAIFLAFSVTWDQLPVLADAYATMAVRGHGLDFGRVRLWGSIAVVLSSVCAGWAIGRLGITTLPILCAGLLLLPVVSAPFLPPDRRMAEPEPGESGRWRDVVVDVKLMRAMAAAAFVMGSHGLLTSFGAIQWAGQGISTGVIGILQALSVSAEILAYFFGTRLLGRRDPALLIWIAAAVSIARWIVMASDPGVPVLVATQLLHGITSTGAILGLTLVIAERVAVQTSAAAQGLASVLLGAVLAVVTAGSGPLWNLGVLPAYLAMAALALLGLLCVWPSSADRPDRLLAARSAGTW